MSSNNSIVGHASQTSDLLADIKNHNVAHAYLFAGPHSVGTFTVAKWFAEQLLTVGMDGDERDDITQSIQKLIHPDLFVIDRLWIDEKDDDLDALSLSTTISQQHRAKAKTKSDVIGIEDVRVLQERLSETTLGQYRVVLIRRVERMQAEGVNALLKMLEEPPPGLVFILTTNDLGSILPTILSRSRILHFARASSADLEPMLKQFPAAERSFVVSIAQGAPGFVKRLLDEPEFLKQEHDLHERAEKFWMKKSVADRLHAVELLFEKGEEADRFLFHLALVARATKVSSDFVKALHGFARALDSNTSRQLAAQAFVMEVTQDAN